MRVRIAGFVANLPTDHALDLIRSGVAAAEPEAVEAAAIKPKERAVRQRPTSRVI
jgi:hypothetical protein